MKKWVIAVLLTIILVGCEGDDKSVSVSDPFLGGTSGLLISFLEDNPPAEVYDGGNFPFEVVIKLSNEGEYDVSAQDIQVKISGVDPSDFNLQPSDVVKHPEEDLRRTYKDAEGNIIDGTITYVSFSGFNFMDQITGNLQYPIRSDVCYTYGTKAISKVCIKEDLVDTDEESLCLVTEDKEVYSSNAPLQITNVKESVRGLDLVGFAFKIEHKGNGEIFQKNSVCNTQGILYENKVWIEVKTGIAGTKCMGLQDGTETTGYITMYSGERTITCTMPADTQTDYEKAVEIDLVYDYQEDITTHIILKHTVD